MSHQPPSPRQLYEERQRHWLACQALAEADCGGRKEPEDEHPYRTCFQRDRDRIVHCSAFRRLDFKTQVFVPHEQDHFRTRLTHTLEVAQIGRTLGRALRLNEDLIEAAALAHDLGHPPFGHGGEQALAELMAGHGGFEHNRQSLRIVDYLEHPYPRSRGLNLTRAVRECLAKHRTRYDAPACPEFDDGLQGPLEGQVVDLADEIAYTAADLEDSLAAGWIDQRQLQELALWQQAWRQAEEAWPRAGEVHKRIRAVKALLSSLADDLIASTVANLQREDVRSCRHVRQARKPCVGLSPAVGEALGQMQDFMLEKVYRHPSSLHQTEQSQRMIAELFGAYVRRPRLLPQRYQARIEADGLERVVCDYVAGMTDRFCRQRHGLLKADGELG